MKLAVRGEAKKNVDDVRGQFYAASPILSEDSS